MAEQTMNIQEINVRTADPSALGLFGLATVTLVASSQKLGLSSGTALIVPWAVFLGSAAQLIAGLKDFQKNNGFGGTAFCAYGLFWLGVAMTWLINAGALGDVLKAAADPKQLGFGFLAYLIFTLIMTVGALGTTKVLFLIFFAIDFLFIGLVMDSFGIGGHSGHAIAAWAELIVSLLSFYGVAANIINIKFGKTIVPMGKPFNVFK